MTRCSLVVVLSLAGCTVETSGLRPGEPVDAFRVDASRDAAPPSDPRGPRDGGGPADATALDAVARDAGQPDAGVDCGPGGTPTEETCNGVDDDCDGVEDGNEPDLCAPGSACLVYAGARRCMFLACPSDPCCADPVIDPCESPYTCEHVAFSPGDCPPECAGQCDNCHMCVAISP